MDIMKEATEQLARKNASALDMLICTGLMKFLGRPVSPEDALEMAKDGRIGCQAPEGRPNNRTYTVDGKPFLFVGEFQMRTERSEGDLSYKLIVDIPHRFIAPPL